MRTLLCVLLLLCISPHVIAQVDTDGDGLLDLVDVPGFDPSRSGNGILAFENVEDLDGVAQLTQLMTLNLSGNHIANIENGDFDGLSNLVALGLSGNQLTSIQRGAFQGLTNLQHLSLIDNQISSIEVGAFEDLPNLQTLYLDGNQLSQFEDGVFSGLASLETLSLAGNQITELASVSLDGLSNLQDLDLGGNQIMNVEAGPFSGLGLQSLGLAGNQITSMEGGAFDGAFDGKTSPRLDLSDNHISSLGPGVVAGLDELRSFSLLRNQITHLDMTGTSIESILPCLGGQRGFCVDRTITRLTLDDANLSRRSFMRLVGESPWISGVFEPFPELTEASIDGLRFTDGLPDNLNDLLGKELLVNVTVDPYLYSDFRDEFEAFEATEGKIVTVVSPDCDGSGVIDIDDAVCTSESKLDRFLRVSGTVRGDADGIGGVDFADFLILNSNFGQSPAVYTDGDFDLDGEVAFSDFLILSGSFGQGRDFAGEVAAVPEPSSGLVIFFASLLLFQVRLTASREPLTQRQVARTVARYRS